MGRGYMLAAPGTSGNETYGDQVTTWEKVYKESGV